MNGISGQKEVFALAEEFVNESPEELPEEKGRPGRELFEWLQMVLGCVLMAVVVFNCFARLTRVDGGSMDNTLQDGELMLVWSLGYEPRQGDIVVLNKTTDETVSLLGGEAIVAVFVGHIAELGING